MANIKDLVLPHPRSYEILKKAGVLGAESGLEVYVVGGFVRDLFLKRPVKEIDLMVVGDGIQFAERLSLRMGVPKIVPFRKFGTAKIPSDPITVEVASARTETYAGDSRKPEEVVYTDLKGDLKRRDFTVNAMAMDILPDTFGNLSDPYRGIQDLQKKTLITPLDPNETFSEDPLRMLRAAYFAAQLDFKIDPACTESMARQADRIQIVSWERITTEILKILETDRPSVGLVILQKTGLMKYVFPEIDAMVGLDQTKEWHHKDIFRHTMEVVDNTARLSEKMELRFAALVHDIAKPRTRRMHPKRGYTFHGHDEIGARMLSHIARRMKLSNDLKKYLEDLTRLHLRPIALAKEGVTDSAIRRVMVAADELIDDLLILCRADITSKNPILVKRYMKNFERVEQRMLDVTERDALRAFQSPVRGAEIMETCGIAPGKTVGLIKKAIEEAILNGEIENTEEAAREYLEQIRDEYVEQKL